MIVLFELISDEFSAAGQAMYAENSNTVYVNNSNVSCFESLVICELKFFNAT